MREPDVAHVRAARHQARGQRQLDRSRIAAEVVADDDLGADAKLLQEAREAEAERLRAHEVDLFFEQPARIIFAKAGRFHHRLRFKGVGVGESFGSGLGNKGTSAMEMWRAALGDRLARGLEELNDRSNPRRASSLARAL